MQLEVFAIFLFIAIAFLAIALFSRNAAVGLVAGIFFFFVAAQVLLTGIDIPIKEQVTVVNNTTQVKEKVYEPIDPKFSRLFGIVLLFFSTVLMTVIISDLRG